MKNISNNNNINNPCLFNNNTYNNNESFEDKILELIIFCLNC